VCHHNYYKTQVRNVNEGENIAREVTDHVSCPNLSHQ